MQYCGSWRRPTCSLGDFAYGECPHAERLLCTQGMSNWRSGHRDACSCQEPCYATDHLCVGTSDIPCIPLLLLLQLVLVLLQLVLVQHLRWKWSWWETRDCELQMDFR